VQTTATTESHRHTLDRWFAENPGATVGPITALTLKALDADSQIADPQAYAQLLELTR
jgi:hypothetical protein